MHRTHDRGFTLVEVMVTIGIVAIFTALTLSIFDMARKKGRDSRRIADIKQLNGAIENYFSTCYSFPEELSDLQDTSGACSNFQPVLLSLPKDPLTGEEYDYYLDLVGVKRFHLCATLEYSFEGNKGRAEADPFDTEDSCDGNNNYTFDVVGGAYQ